MSVSTDSSAGGGDASALAGAGLTANGAVLDNDLKTGKAGGQTVTGGTGAGENLTLESTSNATKGKIRLGTTTSGAILEGPVDDATLQSLGGTSRVKASTGNGTQLFYGAAQLTLAGSFDLFVGLQDFRGRVRFQRSTSAAAAAQLTLPTGTASGNVYPITGTAAPIDFIATASWVAGSIIVLEFSAATVVNHNTGGVPGGFASIKLNGSANRTNIVDGTMQLMYNGTFWLEIPRVT